MDSIVIQGFIENISFIYSNYVWSCWYKEANKCKFMLPCIIKQLINSFLSEALHYIYVTTWSTV